MEVMFWTKFVILFFFLVIVPVWIFNFVDISLLWKLGFTMGGSIGLWLALAGYTMGKKH